MANGFALPTSHSASRTLRSTWARLLRPCSLLVALALATKVYAAPCAVTWDGERLGELAKTRQLSDGIPLYGRDKEVKSKLTARQILAFVEAKDAISRVIGRTAKLLVCSDEHPNAFANKTPDGDILGVTVGMLRLVDGDRDAAAMIVGHEFAHHHKNHMDSSRSRDAALEFLGIIAGIVLESRIQSKTGIQGLGVDLGSIGSNLISRKFDRDQEREADEIGFKYLLEAGFNPKGALRLAERMARISGGSGLFFDTHPGWNERADIIRQIIAGNDVARERMVTTEDFTAFVSVRSESLLTSTVLPLYESSDAEKSYTDALSAFRQRDIANAVIHIRAAAAAGHSKAQLSLGHMMLTGRNGVQKNEVEAIAMFRLAANSGEADAINNLGMATFRGIGGIAKNDLEAAELYRRAFSLGSGVAAKNLGDAHRSGLLGIQKNSTEALSYYKKSDEFGYGEGSAMAGLYFELGDGGAPKNVVTAMTYYKRASERGSALGKYRQALLLLDGKEHILQDERAAISLIQQAANKGLANAQNDLGAYYRKGIRGLPQSDVEAVKWYQLAARQGLAVAQGNLGHMHLQGFGGLRKDANEAGKWFKLGAVQGDVSAEYGLGLLHEFGEGGFIKDRNAAIDLYRRAAAKGHKASGDRLKKLEVAS